MRWRLLACVTLTTAMGCFSDPGSSEGSSSSSGTSCSPGSQGCECVALDCETGLTCQGGLCLPMPDPTDPSATSGSTATATSTTTTPMSTGMSTADTTASSTDGSSSGSSSSGTDVGDETSSSTGSTSVCGDGVIDDDEECDGPPGCDNACELENYGCNPLNNVPCGANSKCAVFVDKDDVLNSECRGFLSTPPLELHDGGCVENSEVQDAHCEPGLACVFPEKSPTCEASCCVEFCDRDDENFECVGAPAVQCRQFFFPPAPTGLEFLGFCALP